MKNTAGWVKINRKMLDWEWYDDGNTLRLFIHCLIRANHKQKKWRGIIVERGEFISSIAKLSEELRLSTQQIRTAITKLIATNNLTTKGRTQHTVFKVKNYNRYQIATNGITNKKQTDNKPTTTNKNDKNEKKNKTLVQIDCAREALFGEFWALYPRKQHRKRAAKAFEKINPDAARLKTIRANVSQRLITGEWKLSEREYIPLPTSYLNGECWNDEPLETETVERVD